VKLTACGLLAYFLLSNVYSRAFFLSYGEALNMPASSIPLNAYTRAKL
jgi:hypothetical protein